MVGVTSGDGVEGGRQMRYQLEVFAISVADAVRRVGGLMFDRSLAGWRVRVCTDDASNARALAILGAEIGSAEPIDAVIHREECVGFPDLHVAGPQFRASVGRSSLDLDSEALRLGPQMSDEPTGLLQPVRRKPSSAARAFKAQALHAAGLDVSMETWESFWATNAVDRGPDGCFTPGAQSRPAFAQWCDASRDLTRPPSLNVVGEFPSG